MLTHSGKAILLLYFLIQLYALVISSTLDIPTDIIIGLLVLATFNSKSLLPISKEAILYKPTFILSK